MPEESTPPTAAPPGQRRRRPPRRRSLLSRLPFTIRYGLPLAVIGALLVMGYQAWFGGLTYISVADLEGAPVRSGKMEFFVFDDTRAARSPSEKLGEQAFEGDGPHGVSWDLVPGAALVRVTADGYGVASAYVEHGQGVQTCDLDLPTSVAGKVIGADGEPAVGARVQAFGSGSHGVLLGETTTGADGHFELGGFSRALAYVRLRVFHDRSALLEQDAWFEQDQEIELALQRTAQVMGRILGVDGAPGAGLHVQAFGVPGVEARSDAEGRFVLHHLPPAPMRMRVVISPIEEGYTHRATWVTPGDHSVEIVITGEAVVEGQVVEETTNTGVARASVQHDHGQGGGMTVLCDENGYFRIGGIPPGEVTLRAFVLTRVRNASGLDPITTRNGARTLELEEGEERSAVGILLH